MKNVCDMRECPDCASSNVICDNAKEQLICKECGLIFEPLAPVEKKSEKAAKKPKKSASKKKKK